MAKRRGRIHFVAGNDLDPVGLVPEVKRDGVQTFRVSLEHFEDVRSDGAHGT